MILTDVSTENENMENITKLQANNRVKSLNPEIYQNLINSERVFSSSFDKYSRLLECVDFDRVFLSMKFLVDMTSEEVAAIGGINAYFARYEHGTFWRQFQPGSMHRSIDDSNEMLIELLKNSFKLARFKINENAKVLFFRDKKTDGSDTIEMIEDFGYDEFKHFLLTLFTPYMRHRYAKKITEYSLEDMVSRGLDDNIIQFLDCYVKDGRVYEGMHPTVGRFLIRRSVHEAVKNRKPTKVVKEVDTVNCASVRLR